MEHVRLVNALERWCNLAHKILHHKFIEPPVLLKQALEVATATELKHKVVVVFGSLEVDEANNIWVSQLLDYLELVLQSLHSLVAVWHVSVQVLVRDFLHCYPSCCLLSLLVNIQNLSFIDCGECAISEFQTHVYSKISNCFYHLLFFFLFICLFLARPCFHLRLSHYTGIHLLN